MTKYTGHSTGECQVMIGMFCTPSNWADAYNFKYYCTVKFSRISYPLITINECQYLFNKLINNQ